MDNKRLPENEWKEVLREADARIKNDFEQAVATIKRLGEQVSAEGLFTAVVAAIAFGPSKYMQESYFGTVPVKLELLAYYLYPLFGKYSATKVTACNINECIRALDTVLSGYMHLGYHKDNVNEEPALDLSQHLEREARIIRGSAYPEQTAKEIIDIQGRFANWFENNMNLRPDRAIKIMFSIMRASEDRFNTYLERVRQHALEVQDLWITAKGKSAKTREEHQLINLIHDKESARALGFYEELGKHAIDMVPVGREELNLLDKAVTESEWEALIALIGLSTELRTKMKDPLEVRQRPLYIMPDGRVVLIDMSNALDVLWDRIDDIAKQHNEFYDKYQKQKAIWLEQCVSDYFSRVFRKEQIYTNLSYSDPNNLGGSTEIDCIIEWGPFLVLVETKARQYQTESQQGDILRLRRDLKVNIEDAFKQVRRAVKYIEQSTIPEFREIGTGRRLIIDKDRIRRTYLITVSQHCFGNLAANLGDLRELELFKESEYPIALGLADLDLMTELCQGPDVFLHYIERRIAIRQEPVKFFADEVDFFGVYLDTRLQPERLGLHGKNKLNFISLAGGWSDQFDAWFQWKRGELEEPPKIRLSVKDEINELLTELRKGNDDAAKWIAFALLDMSDRGHEIIAKGLRKIKDMSLTPGYFRRLVEQDEDTVIVFMASLDQARDHLERNLQVRVLKEKYRRKTSKAIGIGIMDNDPRPSLYWVEGPWERDPTIEKAMENEPESRPAPGQKLPGRNDPCVCGSGKKYKKCCMSKFNN